MVTSYHVHSNFSDGESTIADMVNAAVSIGLDEIGISDHYTLLEGNKRADWGMPLHAIPEYLDTIRAAANAAEGIIVVRSGIEMDFDPATVKDCADILHKHPFDYVIGSIHFIGSFPVDYSKDYWLKLSQDEVNEIIREYWRHVAAMAETRIFDIAGHLDLYKKFGYLPTIDISHDVGTALDAIAAAGMVVELNTAGWHKDIREAYPSPLILAGCARRGISTIITADAHLPEHLTRDYEKARQLLLGAGYTHQAHFAARQMSLSLL